ncbi:hypothetical protein WG294_002000 [Yersinia enterocolitica]
MQDAMYQSELSTKIDSLLKRKRISASHHNYLRKLIREGDYSAIDNILSLSDSDLTDHEVNKNLSWDEYKNSNIENNFNLTSHLEMLKIENEKLQAELSRRTREFKKINDKINFQINELQEKHKKEIQEKVKNNVPDYVENATTQLTEKESRLKKTATIWSWVGFVSLFLSVILSLISIVWGYKEFSALPTEKITWMWISFGLIKGACLLMILFGVAAYALNLSKAYMHESLKLSDRIHAISLGEVYLKIYGHSVSSQEFKDIFENWNISSNSAFHTKPESSDSNKAILQKALEEALPTQLIKNLVSMKSLSKE